MRALGTRAVVVVLLAAAVLGVGAREGATPDSDAGSLPGGPAVWIVLPLVVAVLTLAGARLTAGGLRASAKVLGAVLLVMAVAALLVSRGGEEEPAEAEPSASPSASPSPSRTIESQPPPDGWELSTTHLLAAVAAVAVLVAAALALARHRAAAEGGSLKVADDADGLPPAPEPEAPGAAAAPPPLGDPSAVGARAAVIARYEDLERELAAAGLVRGPAETPVDLLRRAGERGLRTAAAEELTHLFEAARFSTRTVTWEDARRAEELLTAARAGWRAEAGEGTP